MAKKLTQRKMIECIFTDMVMRQAREAAKNFPGTPSSNPLLPTFVSTPWVKGKEPINFMPTRPILEGQKLDPNTGEWK